MNPRRDDRGFLNAIFENPADDLPRLVFADYLEDSGDPDRAEFIRVQCELAAGPPGGDRRRALEARDKELQRRFATQWRLPIRGYQTFRRGFVEGLWTSAESLLNVPPGVLTESSVRTLRITNADARIDALSAYPGFERIEHLDLTNNNLAGDYRLRSILGNPHLGRLRGLNLHNNRLWADDVLRIARSPVAIRLTHLDLSGNGIGTEGTERLAGEAAFKKLGTLILRSDGLPEYESLDATAMGTLADSPHFRLLRSLDVSGHNVGHDGVAALALAEWVGGLVHLDLSGNRIEGSLPELFETLGERATNLLTLDFSGHAIDADAVAFLARWPKIRALGTLRLLKCDMPDAARQQLRESPYAAKFILDEEPSP